MKTPAIKRDIYRPEAFADSDISPTSRHALDAIAPFKKDCIKNFRRRIGETKQIAAPRGGWPQFGPDGQIVEEG